MSKGSRIWLIPMSGISYTLTHHPRGPHNNLVIIFLIFDNSLVKITGK